MSEQTPVNLEEQSDTLSLQTFKFTMYTVWGFIIVAAYIVMTTVINEDLYPEVPADHGHHGHDDHKGHKDHH